MDLLPLACKPFAVQIKHFFTLWCGSLVLYRPSPDMQTYDVKLPSSKLQSSIKGNLASRPLLIQIEDGKKGKH
jgi:hypothetical protein